MANESKSTSKLPDRLSDLIDLAVADSIKATRDPKLKLFMSEWVRPQSAGPCLVCMAGAVMVNTLRFSRHRNWLCRPAGRNDRKLYAINNARSGDISGALDSLRQQADEEQERAVARAEALIARSYTGLDGGRATWAAYRKAARILRKAGL